MKSRATFSSIAVLLLAIVVSTPVAESSVGVSPGPAPAFATGSLTVTINPADARSDVQWSINDGGTYDGTTYYDSGETITGVQAGTHTISVSGFGWHSTEFPINVTISAGVSNNRTITMEMVTGFAQVNISPQDAIDNGALWSVDYGNTWAESGDELELQEGTYEVIFSDVAGYVKPGLLDILVQDGAHDSYNATYTPLAGNAQLEVFIEPLKATYSGAFWSIDGGSNWNSSGDVLSVSPGNYTITFKDILEYIAPADIAVNLASGDQKSFTGTYAAGPTGSLRITLAPQQAIDDGTQWRIGTDDTYHNSGYTIADAPVGTNTIYFTGSNWKKTGATAEVTEGNLTTKTITLEKHVGYIEVTLNPGAAGDYGAAWSIDNGQTWYTSGQKAEVAPGGYTIKYKTIPYFNKPLDLWLHVSKDETETATGTYTRLNGSLRIDIEPSDLNGAAWKIAGAGSWNFSGQTETNLAAGEYEIVFQDLFGYTAPESFLAQVYGNQLNVYSAKYTSAEGSVSVTINDNSLVQNVNEMGAAWKVVGSSEWLSSGDSVSLLPGPHTIQFAEVEGWNTPSTFNFQLTENANRQFSRAYQKIPPQFQGQVVDEFGVPMAGVMIQVSRGDQIFTTVRTDSKGRYLIEDLPTGQFYTVRPIYQDYAFSPAVAYERIVSNSSFTSNFTGDYDPSDLVISGTVRDSSGQRIAEAVLQMGTGADSTRANTDSNGRYEFTGLRSGPYEITLLGADDYIVDDPGTKTVILDDESQDGVDFGLLKAGLRISGKVRAFDGSAIKGVEVELRGDLVSETEITGQFDSSGRYIFRNLPAGDYVLEVLDTDRLYKSRVLKITITRGYYHNVDFVEQSPTANTVRVAGLTVAAESITQISETVWKTSGLAYIGKHRLIQTQAELTLDQGNQQITGNGKVWAPSIPSHGEMIFFNGEFTIEGPDFAITQNHRIEDFGLLFTINTAENLDDYLKLTATFKLNIGVFDLSAVADFHATSDQLKLAAIEVKSGNKLKIKDWGLSNVVIKYVPEKNIIGGGGKLETPLLAIGAYLEFYEGILNAVGLEVGGEIPIYPHVLFLTGAKGLIGNLADPEEPIKLMLGAAVGIGPKVGLWRLVEANGDFTINVAGSFVAKVIAKMFGFEIGRVTLNYDHQPQKKMRFQAKLKFGYILYLEGDADVQAYFEPFNVWGSAQLSAILRTILVGAQIEETIASMGTSFTKEELRMWATLLGAELEAVVDGKSFRITKPDWLTGVEVVFSEDGSVVNTAGFNVSPSGAIVIPANNKTVHQVAAGLDKLNFMIAWRGDGSITPTIIGPDGTRYNASRSENSFSFVRIHERAVSYTFPKPAGGEWKIAFPNNADVGTFTAFSTAYEPLPGIAIEDVLPAGGKSYEIVLSRSGMDVEEEVALFYGPRNQPGVRNLIASSEELADNNTYVWDASNVTAGNYYVYARISNGERRPFTYRFENAISITGDPGKRMVRQPKVKVVKDGLKVRWQKLNRSDVQYYRVYFTDTVNQRGYGQYLDFPAHRASGLLDHEVMVPGRFYRLATAAIFTDGSEGPLSNPRRLRYISSSANNPPFFPFAPEDRVAAGGKLDFFMRARDYDKDTLRYSLLRAPEGATINPGSGRLEWSPGEDEAGFHLFQVSVRDDQGGSESINWNVFVGNKSEQGILDARSIVKSSGEKGYVLAYWNPHLNTDPGKPELLHGKISNSASPGTASRITFHESGADSGYFAAVVTESEMQTIRAAAVGGASISSSFLDNFLVEITGEERREKTIISLEK